MIYLVILSYYPISSPAGRRTATFYCSVLFKLEIGILPILDHFRSSYYTVFFRFYLVKMPFFSGNYIHIHSNNPFSYLGIPTW